MNKFLILNFILLSCSGSINYGNSVSHQNPNDELVCSIAITGSEWDYTVIETIFKLPDSCVYSIIDSLKNKVAEDSNAYMKLNFIYLKSDGEISEYFMDVMTELFNNHYSNLSIYLYRNSKKDKLYRALIEGLSMDISMSENPDKQRNLIKSKIINESKNSEVKRYMLELEEKIDPELFD